MFKAHRVARIFTDCCLQAQRATVVSSQSGMSYAGRFTQFEPGAVTIAFPSCDAAPLISDSTCCVCTSGMPMSASRSARGIGAVDHPAHRLRQRACSILSVVDFR